MNRPTVAQAEAWNPDALRRTADEWDAAATELAARVDAVVHTIDGSRDFWSGSAAEAARGHGGTIAAGGAVATRCLITAAVAARDGAAQLGSARDAVLALVAAARAGRIRGRRRRCRSTGGGSVATAGLVWPAAARR